MASSLVRFPSHIMDTVDDLQQDGSIAAASQGRGKRHEPCGLMTQDHERLARVST